MIGQQALLLVTGAALGAHGLGLLTRDVLAYLDPAVPVAMGVLGVAAACSLPSGSGMRRSLAASGVTATLAGVLAAAGTLVVGASMLSLPPDRLVWLALVIATCASLASVTGIGIVFPVVAGGLVIAGARVGAAVPAASLVLQASAITIVIAVAGWLLLAKASSDAEQRVFGVATLLLLGGAADYLSLSALMSGLIAGACWRRAGGTTRESICRDAAYLQPPAFAFVLLVAGARVEFSPALAVLALGYISLSAAGGVAQRWWWTQRPGRHPPGELAGFTIEPGILSVAVALTAFHALGQEMVTAVSVAALGAIGSQLLRHTSSRPAPR